MRLIYTKDGFNKNEKEEWRIIIFNNILDGLRMTIDAMEEFGIDFEYSNTTVCPGCLRTRCGPTLNTNNHLAGTSSNSNARKGPSTIRAHTGGILASFQGYVEGPWYPEGH